MRMRKLWRGARRQAVAFLKDDRGSQGAEYAFLVLLAVGVTGALGAAMGGWLNTVFAKVTAKVASTNPSTLQ